MNKIQAAHFELQNFWNYKVKMSGYKMLATEPLQNVASRYGYKARRIAKHPDYANSAKLLTAYDFAADIECAVLQLLEKRAAR